MDKFTCFHCINILRPQKYVVNKLPPSSPPPSTSISVHCLTSSLVRVAEDSFNIPSYVSVSTPSSADNSSVLLRDEIIQMKYLDSMKQLHAQLIKSPNRWKSDTTITENLITSYLKFNDFESSVTIFFLDYRRNYSLWRSFIEEYKSFGGDPCEILEVFSELQTTGVKFDARILTVVLKLCAVLRDGWLGLEIHAYLFKMGFDSDDHLKSALMNLYGRCWGTECADKVFSENPQRGLLLWNEAIATNIQNDRLFEALQMFRDMQLSFVKPDCFTIAKALQACKKVGAMDELKQLNGYVFRNCMEKDLAVCNSLISAYSKNENIELARRVFDSMESRNLSSWNSMISGYAALGYFDCAKKLLYKMESHDVRPDVVTWNSLLSSHFRHGLYHEVLILLQNMLVSNVEPNSSSMTRVIQATTELNLMKSGREIHCYVIRKGIICDMYVHTTLVDMYMKNKDAVKARSLFNLMRNRNNIAWNSLISGYSSMGQLEDARNSMESMQDEGLMPDLASWNSLVSGYSTTGRASDALATMDEMKNLGLNPNVVSWTALISGRSKQGNYRDSLRFFNQMLEEGIEPNSVTISSLLQACAGLSLLKMGKEIHCWCIRNGFIKYVVVVTGLVDMYVKSGSLTNAVKIFSRTTENRTVATWNCMIMGFAIYGYAEEAIMLFNEMLGSGFQPDSITFTAVLSGCKNSGLVEEGWKYFDSMRPDHDVTPSIEHYSCMIDLLGRAGYVDEAWDFMRTMPMKPDASVWGALLGSCRTHNNLELGKVAARHLSKLEPYNSANYVITMNLYSMANRWDEVDRLKDKMKSLGMKTKGGWSWIQIGNKVHIFNEGEGSPHPDAGEIYFELYQLISEIKKAGYVPDTKCVYQNTDDTEKEKVLLSHPEKLAITYGLIKMKDDGSPIRVIKNTRICSDCHLVARFVSWVKKREVILKDGVRFHHFKDGRCSCNNCW